MKRKIKIIFSFYFFAMIISSCCKTDTFNTEITKIQFVTEDNFISQSENLEFKVKTIDEITTIAFNFDLGLIPSAFAYDCDEEDTLIPNETVENIDIKTLTDFSDEFQVNEFITELIKVRFFNWRSEEIEIITLEAFLDFVNSDDSPTARTAELNNATFILANRPTIQNNQQFELTFTLTDNNIFTILTEELVWE